MVRRVARITTRGTAEGIDIGKGGKGRLQLLAVEKGLIIGSLPRLADFS